MDMTGWVQYAFVSTVYDMPKIVTREQNAEAEKRREEVI
jgi:hypothetical protein